MYCILSALPLREDLEYWMIDAAYMEFCCSEKFFMKRDILQVFKHLNLDPMFFLLPSELKLSFFLFQEEMEETAAKLEKDDEEDFGSGKFAK